MSRINCPRCTLQMPGWMIQEDGYTHCVMCGYVQNDESYRGTGLIEVVKKGIILQRQKVALRRWKGDEIV